MLGWIAWSIDRKFDSRTHSAHDLPHTLQLVKGFREGGGCYIVTGAKSDLDVWYIFFPSGRVLRHEGSAQEAGKLYPDAIIRKGTWTDNANYERICKEARATSWNGTKPILKETQ